MDDYQLDMENFSPTIYVTNVKEIFINFFYFMYAYCEFCIDNHMI